MLRINKSSVPSMDIELVRMTHPGGTQTLGDDPAAALGHGGQVPRANWQIAMRQCLGWTNGPWCCEEPTVGLAPSLPSVITCHQLSCRLTSIFS